MTKMVSAKRIASTLIVFDWDNTLFPTTRVLELTRTRKVLSKQDVDELGSLSQWVYSVLYAYISQYSAQNIRIVTAADRGWFEKSLQCLSGIGWWSAIRNLLFDPALNIKITFPRREMLPFKPNSKDVFYYKLGAFQNLCLACRPSLLISIGDSRAEYAASKECVKSVGRHSLHISLGRIKLKAYPSIRCMIQQSQFVLDLCGRMEPKDYDLEKSL